MESTLFGVRGVGGGVEAGLVVGAGGAGMIIMGKGLRRLVDDEFLLPEQKFQILHGLSE